METTPRRQTVAVIICGRTWDGADRKVRDWIKAHPNERIFDRLPVVLTTSYENWCCGLIVESDEESLPSDFDLCSIESKARVEG